MIEMSLSTNITGFDKFMYKFNKKKEQADNSEVKNASGKKPAAHAPKNS